MDKDEGVSILETIATINKNCTKEIDGRIEKAGKICYKYHTAVMCKRGYFRKTSHLLERWVLPARTYNIGTLNGTQRHLQRIRNTEATMQRWECRWRFPGSFLNGLEGTDAERAANYVGLVSARLKSLRSKCGLERWDTVVLSRDYDWAGHVARFQKSAPDK